MFLARSCPTPRRGRRGRQQIQKRQLCPSVSFSKRMNGIQFCQKTGGRRGEFASARVASEWGARKFLEQPVHRAVDVLGIAERIASLAGAHCSASAGPTVHILKQVPMDLAI